MNRRIIATCATALMVAAIYAAPGASSAAEEDSPSPSLVLVSAEALTTDGSHDIEYYVDIDEVAPWALLQHDKGNKQLSQDYAYNDPRRALFNGGEPGVTHGVHPANTSADAGLSDQMGVMHDALATWEAVQCSDLGLIENAIPPTFQGIVNIFFQTGSLPLIHTADLTQVGFFSAAEFPYFAANPNVLGVAFTLSWVDGNGNLTDIDGDGKSDVAFREIYYNDQFEWVDDGSGERGEGVFDFTAVATHEVGHGLSQAHFGKIIRTADGAIVARPTALMNAVYGGPFEQLAGTDVAGHCSIWDEWPLG